MSQTVLSCKDCLYLSTERHFIDEDGEKLCPLCYEVARPEEVAS